WSAAVRGGDSRISHQLQRNKFEGSNRDVAAIKRIDREGVIEGGGRRKGPGRERSILGDVTINFPEVRYARARNRGVGLDGRAVIDRVRNKRHDRRRR